MKTALFLLSVLASCARTPERRIPVWAEAKRGTSWIVGLPREVTDRATGIELVLIPPGSYSRGANDDDNAARPNEKPRRLVTISKAFYLGRYEVTVPQFHEGVTGEGVPPPATMMFLHDIVAWLSKRGFRLPSEAEWEYAAKAGESRTADIDSVAWYDRNSGGHKHSVGELKPNAFGLYDMLGNASEICADRYSESAYATGPYIDPLGPDVGRGLVLRGGSFADPVWVCRATWRGSVHADLEDTGEGVGLRVARDP